MNAFHRIDDELYCEDVSLLRLAREFGTPAYIYSKKSISDNAEAFFRAFASIDMQLCFSVKSNPNLSILHLMGNRGAGADIVSGGELFRALRAGIAPAKIVYSGVGKTAGELREALGAGIGMFNIESEQELFALSALAHSLGAVAPIALRVNPDIDADTHHYTTTGKKENKFGLPLDSAVGIYKKALGLPGIDPIGIAVHLGSPIFSLKPYQKALDLLSGLIEQLRPLGINIRVLDIGGGFGITYKDEEPFTPGQFAGLVMPYVKKLGCRLFIEPGRFIVGNAAVLLTSITYIKKTDAKLFYICDAGMNDLIRPALYGSHHEIAPVQLPRQSETVIADIVGPICESSDFFAKNRPIERLEQGGLLAVKGAGAYGFSMSSQYNSRPRACEVLVDGASCTCIRSRESYEDLIRNDLMSW